MRNLFLLSIAMLSVVAPLSASTLEISMGGTFNSQTIPTSWAAPDASWTMSFDIDSNPIPTSSYAGVGFDAPISNFVYTLNGSAISIGPADILFLSNTWNGPMAVSLSGCCATAFENLPGFQFAGGPQLYSGPESSPTILTGNFVAAGYLQIATNNVNGAVGQGPITITNNSAVTFSVVSIPDVQTVPEPTTGIMLMGVTAFGGLVLASKRARVV